MPNFKNYPYNLSVIDLDCTRVVDRVDLRDLKEQTILVTGANGLIGSFVADLCCFLNDTFSYNIKLYLTSYSEKENAKRILHCVNREDVKYFSWDCSFPIEQENLPSKIDYTFFCSGYGQPSKFLKDTIKTALINVVGPDSILKYMSENNGGNFLFLSTSEVYGNPSTENIPTPENYEGNSNLENNRASYIASKKLGEVICYEYNKLSKMNVKCARVALSYGPGILKNDGRVLQDFIIKAATFKKIKMLDEGDSIRHYIYISDCVEILLNMTLHGEHFVYNVGGDTEPVSIFGLAQKVGNFFDAQVIPNKNKKSKESIKSAPSRVGLDMTRYRHEFPTYGQNLTSLDKGIENILRWLNLQ